MNTRWYTAQPAAFVNAHPAVAAGLAYFGLTDGGVVARDVGTGAERWRAAPFAGGRVRGGNLVVGRGVVVVPGASEIAALDGATGQARWRYAPPADPTIGGGAGSGLVLASRLDVDDERVYVPAYGASVSGVDLETGATRWVWTAGATEADTAPRAPAGRFRSGASSVRVAGEVVYATVWHSLDTPGLTCEVWLVALDRRSGRELWRTVERSRAGGLCVDSGPAVTDDRVIVSHRGGDTFAVERATGRVAWRWAAPARYSTYPGPALADANTGDPVVYVDGGDEAAYVLGVRDGVVRQRIATAVGATTDFAVTARRLYHVNNGTLRVFDRVSGQPVALLRTREENGVFGGLAATSGRVYLAGFDGAWALDEP